MTRSLILLVAAAITAAALPAHAAAPESRLVGRAYLPADTFAPGPTSGRYLGDKPINGRQGPFVDKHPVQGFSGVLSNGDGTFMLTGDNGFGALENSADHELRVYHVRPDFKGPAGAGSGRIEILGHFTLSDPDGHLNFPIKNQFTKERKLTGADFDLESIQRATDGSYWFGDEFGPFLIHTDARGKLLEPPVALPDPEHPGREIRSPQNPYHEETAALRVMNALRSDALAHGATRMPVFSPAYTRLDDLTPGTVYAGEKGEATAGTETFDVRSLRAAGHGVVPWTVNDPTAMRVLLKLGVTGIISDSPDLLYREVAAFDADGDGKPGDYLTRDGLIDPAKFDAQGHRGARDLRPENTLPAFEAALDHLMNTLETDIAITKDGMPVLSHDPVIDHVMPVRSRTFAEWRQEKRMDELKPERKRQSNDLALSPVAVAFARDHGLPHPYAMPSLEELVAFTRYYTAYYRAGEGKDAPHAKARADNAERVRFNVETKIRPDWETLNLTPNPEAFTRTVGDALRRAGVDDRAQLQSFDYRTLLAAHRAYPSLQTVWLLGDHHPFMMDKRGPGALPYPFHVTRRQAPFRAQRTGGFEGMAMALDGSKLYPMLEKPLEGHPKDTLIIAEFDLKARRYTDQRWKYRYEPGSTSVADFIMVGDRTGLVIERDDAEGKLDAFKRVYRVTLGAPGSYVKKELVADLMTIRDPHRISLPGMPGDVGLGDPFALPYFTIEGLVKLGPRRLGVVTDNNYPYSVGRHQGSGQPDGSDFIVIELDQAL